MKKSKIDSQLYRLTLEKMVVGLEEPILIKGVGEILAKIDSGNAGYNVIHGEDLTVQGDILTFKTQNKDGKDRRVSKKIKEKLNVNIGGGHVQERPVVELDVQIGGQEYKKILFSVTDRSSNDNKVLISADFVGKELDALIDVTKKKIADDNVKVDYVTENLFSGIKNAASAVGNAAQAVKRKGQQFQKGLENMADKAKERSSWVFGEPAKTKVDPQLAKDITNEIGDMDSVKKMQAEDEAIIKKMVPGQGAIINSSALPDSIQINVLLNYIGAGPDESKSYPPGYKEKLKKALTAAKKLVRKSNGSFAEFTGSAEKSAGLKTESTILNVLRLLKEEGENQQTTRNTVPPSGQTTQLTDNEENPDGQPEDPKKQAQNVTEKDPSDMNGAELQALFDDLKARNKFIYYFVSFGTDKNNGPLLNENEVRNKVPNIVDPHIQKISASKNFDAGSFKNTSSAITESLKTSFADEIKAVACYALCTGPLGSRKCEVFCDEKELFDNVGLGKAASENAANEKRIIEALSEIKPLFNKICSALGLNLEFNSRSIGKIRARFDKELGKKAAEKEQAYKDEMLSKVSGIHDNFVRR